MSKQTVLLTITSTQTDGEQRVDARQTRRGELYDRDGAWYLLYEEDDTTTTMRIDDHAIRVHRRGLVNGWQEFVAGQWTGGLLGLGGNDLVLRVHTSDLHIDRRQTDGAIELCYELWTASPNATDPVGLDESLGHFTLKLSWRPVSLGACEELEQ